MHNVRTFFKRTCQLSNKEGVAKIWPDLLLTYRYFRDLCIEKRVSQKKSAQKNNSCHGHAVERQKRTRAHDVDKVSYRLGLG